MSNKHIMVSLDDEKLTVLAEVLSNKTSKKILEHLADKEASESDISRDLNLPANTVNYNIKKLIESGLIEKSKNYFWSSKGKKMPVYRVAKKSIIISPKSSHSAGIIGAVLLTGISAFVVKIISSNYSNIPSISKASDGVMGVAESANFASQIPKTPEIWVWFLLGGIAALIFYMILNWRKL